MIDWYVLPQRPTPAMLAAAHISIAQYAALVAAAPVPPVSIRVIHDEVVVTGAALPAEMSAAGGSIWRAQKYRK